MDPELPDFPFEDWEDVTEEGGADEVPEHIDWNTIDQELFGAE